MDLTEFIDLDPTRVDLVAAPAHGVEFLLLKAAATREAEFAELVGSMGSVGLEVFKSVAEQRFTLGVAYAANHADVSRAKDGFRDFAGPDVVKKAAWNFLRNGARVGLDHQDGTDGTGTVVESFLHRGGDWPQESGFVVKSGDWLLGVVWPEPTWQAIKSGKRRGLSMQGGARRRRPSPEALARLR